MSTLSCLMRLQGDNLDDTLSKPTKADRKGEHNGKNKAA